MPPSRNLGTGNKNCGGHAALIVAAGARKEKLRQRDFPRAAARPKPQRYAELRVASAFSFLDGASLPEDLVEEAARREIPAVALVDRNGVYGAPRFWKAAKAAGVKALVGAEVTVRTDRHPEERSDEGSQARKASRRVESGILRCAQEDGEASRHIESGILRCAQEDTRLTLLVESRIGYRNLCRLITAGALGKPKGETRVCLDQAAEHAAGLHVLTGGDEGPLAQALSEGGLDAARALLEKLAAIFPGRSAP